MKAVDKGEVELKPRAGAMQAIKAIGEGGQRFTPPMFSHVWSVSSANEENDKGSWKGYKFEVEGPIAQAELFLLARESRTVFQTSALRPPVETNDAPTIHDADSRM